MKVSKNPILSRLSLILAIIMLIGFVPVFDLDFTASAASDTITLSDDMAQSGDNWVWDNTTQTLSLYNAKFSPAAGNAVFQYDGTNTLKINQIGYNLIENGRIAQTSNPGANIEVIGSGILEISNSSGSMFTVDELILSNGYIVSSNANDLGGQSTVTVSNCVLDIPNTEINTLQEFTMNSGYVNCNKLVCYSICELNGGYLVAKTIEEAMLKFKGAVAKADTCNKVSLAASVSAGSSDLAGLLLYKSGLSTSSGSSATITTSDNYTVLCIGSGNFIPADGTVPTSFSANTAYYFDSDATITNAETNTATIVCNGKLTLNDVCIDGFPDGTTATVYANELDYSSTDKDRYLINGCTIADNVTLDNAFIGNFGRLYCKNKLTLNSDCVIEGFGGNGGRKNAETGAITVYSTREGLGTKTLNFNSHELKVRGDFSVKASSNTPPFAETEKNIVVSGECGQFAAAYSNSNNTQMITPDALSTIAAASKEAAESYNRTLAVYNAGNIGEKLSIYTTGINPKSLYIGDEFRKQLLTTGTDEDIIFVPTEDDSASFEFICSHDVDLDNVSVSIDTDSDKFEITKSYPDETNENKFKVTITLKEGEQLTVDNKYKVTVTVDGLTAENTFKAVGYPFGLDFTAASGAWNYHGEFEGSDTECKADNDSWAWYPDGNDDYTGKTLVINGLAFTTTVDNAIIVPDGTTIVVNGENTIHSVYTALKSDGAIIIFGGDDKAKLTATSDEVTHMTRDNVVTNTAAILANSITIRGCEIEVLAKKAINWNGYWASSEHDTYLVRCFGIEADTISLCNVKGSVTAGPNLDNTLRDYKVHKSTAIWAFDLLEIGENVELTLYGENCALYGGELKLDGATEITLTDGYESDKSTAISSITSDKTDYTVYTKDKDTATVLKTPEKKVTVTVKESFEDADPVTTTETVTKNSLFKKTFGKDGYYISEVKIDGADKLSSLVKTSEADGQALGGYLFLKSDDLEKDVDIEVVYRIASRNVTLTVGDHGAVIYDVTDLTKVTDRKTVNFTINPDAGYAVSAVEVNGADVTVTDNKFSVLVDKDYTIKVEFEKNDCTLAGHGTSDKWEFDETSHWHICPDCNEKTDVSAHVYGADGKCECGKVKPVETTTTVVTTAPPETTTTTTTTTSTTYPIYTGYRPNIVTTTTATTTTTTTTTTTVTDTTTTPVYDEPFIVGEDGKIGWEVIEEQIDETADGEKLIIDMNGTTKLPETILEAIMGRDVTIVLEMDNGFAWTINGADVTDPKTVDLRVTEGSSIKAKVINALTGECSYIEITLKYNGEFGFTATLTVKLGKENKGLFANLYYYNDDGEFELISSGKIGKSGKADLEFTHASEYVIVIDDYDHSAKPVDDEIVVTPPVEEDPNPATGVTLSFSAVILAGAVVMATKKKRK